MSDNETRKSEQSSNLDNHSEDSHYPEQEDHALITSTSASSSLMDELDSNEERDHTAVNGDAGLSQAHIEEAQSLLASTSVSTAFNGTTKLADNFDLSSSTSELPETVDLSAANDVSTVTVSSTSQDATLLNFSANDTLDISKELWQEYLAGQLSIVGSGNAIDVYHTATGKTVFHLEADHNITFVGVAPQSDGSVHLSL